MTARRADVVVVGGGVNGASIAMHLARMGAGRVLLLEKGHLASGASGRSGAMVRLHYLHPTLVRMAMEASEVFHNFDDAVGGNARFVQTGRLLLFPEHDADAARANVAMNREVGANIRMISLADAAELAPGLSLEGVALAAYEPDAGHADPLATTYAFADRARDLGAELVTGCAVRRIVTAGGRVTGVATDAGLVETDAVVAVTGPWVNQLAAPLGEPLPVTPVRVQMVTLRRPPSLESLSAIIMDHTTGTYLRVNAGSTTLAGAMFEEDLGEVVDPDAYALNADHDAIMRYWGRAKRRVPDFALATPPRRLRFPLRPHARRQPHPRRLGVDGGPVLGDGLQRPRLQALAGGRPHDGRARPPRRQHGPPHPRLPRQPLRRRRAPWRRASLHRPPASVGLHQ